MASAVDDLSNGRLILGLGTCWKEREHEMYGFNLLDQKARFDRMQEGLMLIKSLFENDEPFSFNVKYYQANGAVLLPRHTAEMVRR